MDNACYLRFVRKAEKRSWKSFRRLGRDGRKKKKKKKVSSRKEKGKSSERESVGGGPKEKKKKKVFSLTLAKTATRNKF